MLDGSDLIWSFVRAGLGDELSIMLTPAADGVRGAQTPCEANDRYAVNGPDP